MNSRIQIMEIQTQAINAQLSRRQIIMKSLPFLVDTREIDNNLNYLFEQEYIDRRLYVQSVVNHMVSGTETWLWIAFTTEDSKDAFQKTLKQISNKKPIYWQSKRTDAAGNQLS